MKAFLAAGHTPRSPGATAWHGDREVQEHELALEIVDQIAWHLQVVRPVIVPSIGLGNRIHYVNRWWERGDVAVSVHMNAFEDPEVSGVETFYDEESLGGLQLATLIQSAVVTNSGRPSRGVKEDAESQHHDLAWLSKTKPRAALLEVEFLTNPEALAWLLKTGTPSKLGEAIARAIEELDP